MGRTEKDPASTIEFIPVIGLEIHARLLTRTKAFCSCANDFGAAPNSRVCPICLGYPGALPVLNGRVVELALRTAVATGCTINDRSVFARKNYFYPDLPKGYQISQYKEPLATRGRLEFGDAKTARIQRIHIEEDAGKLLHGGISSPDVSLVDLNRAGAPLIEIVTEPDFASAEEASAFVARLRQLLIWLDVSDGNMEEGSLRCDVNVSVRREGEPYGVRAEIKNLNSFRFLRQAIAFEISRQSNLVSSGGSVVQETRLYDPASGETRSMRSKEEAHDYRYLDEPDLPPLTIAPAAVTASRDSLPELPLPRARRFAEQYGVTGDDADVLTGSRQLADYFEAAAARSPDVRLVANWVRTEVLRLLNERMERPESFVVTPARLARLLDLVHDGTISGSAAKTVFEAMLEDASDPAEIVERKGLAQISDAATLTKIAKGVIDAHPEQLADYRRGRTKLLGFFVGKVMKESAGRANAELANRIVRELLESA